MKMRPLRVKVRKPINEDFDDVEEDIDPMDDIFGLKKVTNDELVLDPTPAVPGRPVSTQICKHSVYSLQLRFSKRQRLGTNSMSLYQPQHQQQFQ